MLPIGGVTQVILPKANEKDLRDVPESVRRDLMFVLAEEVGDVLRASLAQPPG